MFCYHIETKEFVNVFASDGCKFLFFKNKNNEIHFSKAYVFRQTKNDELDQTSKQRKFSRRLLKGKRKSVQIRQDLWD